MTDSRAWSPITANARSRSCSARASSAACCLRRSIGVRPLHRRRGSVRWWRPSDPVSGQPDSKATPASILPYEYVFRGFVLSRKALSLPEHAWWVRVAVAGGFAYLIADNRDLTSWSSWLRSLAGEDLAEYSDFGGGVYRAASFAGEALETCLFLGPARDAADWSFVKELFAAAELGDDQRRSLLSGRAASGQPSAGPVVCACFGVGRTTICDAIAGGIRSAADLGAALKAGTNCGSCIPELKRLIGQAGTADPEPSRLVAANYSR